MGMSPQIGGKWIIRYGVESWSSGPFDDDDRFFQIEGVVFFSSPGSNADEGTVCGRLRAYILRANELIDSEKFSTDAWFDEEELNDIANNVYDRNGRWAVKVSSMWSGIKSMDVLVIEEIFIEKQYRGMDIGLAIAERTISLFGRGCGIAAISPWPTEVHDKENEEEARDAHRKIGAHSERIGFKNLPGTDLWIRSLEHKMDRASN